MFQVAVWRHCSLPCRICFNSSFLWDQRSDNLQTLLPVLHLKYSFLLDLSCIDFAYTFDRLLLQKKEQVILLCSASIELEPQTALAGQSSGLPTAENATLVAKGTFVDGFEVPEVLLPCLLHSSLVNSQALESDYQSSFIMSKQSICISLPVCNTERDLKLRFMRQYPFESVLNKSCHRIWSGRILHQASCRLCNFQKSNIHLSQYFEEGIHAASCNRLTVTVRSSTFSHYVLCKIDDDLKILHDW